MVTTWHEDLIAGIHAQLDEDLGEGHAIPYTIGYGERVKHHAARRVAWITDSGQTKPTERAGGAPTVVIGRDWQLWTVEIWMDTVQNCRITHHNLVNAARKKWGPYAVDFCKAYSWVKDSESGCGHVLTLKVETHLVIDGVTLEMTDPENPPDWSGTGNLIKSDGTTERVHPSNA